MLKQNLVPIENINIFFSLTFLFEVLWVDYYPVSKIPSYLVVIFCNESSLIGLASSSSLFFFLTSVWFKCFFVTSHIILRHAVVA